LGDVEDKGGACTVVSSGSLGLTVKVYFFLIVVLLSGGLADCVSIVELDFAIGTAVLIELSLPYKYYYYFMTFIV